MRSFRYWLVGLLALLAAGPAAAQVKVEQVRVGFRTHGGGEDTPGLYKLGLWAPVYVDLTAGPKGIGEGKLLVETPDSEDIGTTFTTKIPKLDKKEKRTIVSYVRVGNSSSPKLTYQTEEGDKALSVQHMPLDLAAHLYLSLGARLPDLDKALVEQQGDNLPTRFAAFESDVGRLPAEWFGYDGVDLIILTTDNVKFIERLRQDQERLEALAKWVRRGGRLVVSVSWSSQTEVSALLEAPAWHPPLLATIPKLRDQPAPDKKVKQIHVPLDAWAGVRNERAFLVPENKLAQLHAGKKPNLNWEILLLADERPAIVTMPYGLGQVTYLAVDLTKEPFATWGGRKQFYLGMLDKLAPKVNPQRDDRGGMSDLATFLQRTLDNFDVPVINFGWVALFILIYIVIVGPLDYFLLKKVFKRLEWTWITFPTVVIAISVIAYFTAYALKGREQKTNVVDLVDFDLRTHVDENGKTEKAHVYGQAWFTLLSPRIKSYTIGVEPALHDEVRADKLPSADVVGWFGRPEYAGFGAMGRPRSGFTRRPYDYAADAKGLFGVPIPVWTSKSFTASWELPWTRKGLPFEIDLGYHRFKDPKVEGTIKSNLNVDLDDLWLFYNKQVFPVPGSLPGGGTLRVAIDRHRDLAAWPGHVDQNLAMPFNQQQFANQASRDPTNTVKYILFHEKVDGGRNFRNHSYRRLDLSQRLGLKEDEIGAVRQAVLFGRARTPGPWASHIWLDHLPGSGANRPSLSGDVFQNTYVRLIVPVRPKE